MKTERSGKPAPTVEGNIEQARQWLANPALDDRGLGRYHLYLYLLSIHYYSWHTHFYV